MTRAIVVKRVGATIVLAPGSSLTAQAQAASTTAVAAALTAETARDVALTEGPFYTSVGAGEAATTTGQEFAVVVDGVASWYRRTGGGSDLLYTLPTTATTARITTRAGLETVPVGGTAYATDVNATYQYNPLAVATADGWGVIAALGGVGRWILLSGSVSVPARGSGLDDAPNLIAAMAAMANMGRSVVTPDALYTIDSVCAFPRKPVALISPPSVEFEGTLTPDGSPATAIFYCSAGGDVIVDTGELTAGALPSSKTVTIDVEPDVGQYLRVRDNVSGAQVILGDPVQGFTGATYQVRGVSGSGPYVVTLDRPLRFPLEAGDEAVIMSEVARGHRIVGRPTIKGTAVRAIEFVGTWDCDLDVRIEADGLTDVGGSFDLFGYRNRARGEIIRTTGPCKDGWLLESNERSVAEFTVKGFTAGTGVSIFHGIDCDDFSDCSGNDIGAAMRGYGIHGCIGGQLAGRYDANLSQGAALINGTTGARATGSGRHNPINLAIGDPSGGSVKNTHVEGDWSQAIATDPTLAIGIFVAESAIGTTAGAVDVSDSDIGILANGSIDVAHHRHHGEVHAATGGVIVATDDAIVNVAIASYDVDEAANVVRTSDNARVRLNGGKLLALGGSNLLRPGGNSRIELGAGFVGDTSDGTGNAIQFDSSTATVVVDKGADLTGVGERVGGSAGAVIYPAGLLYGSIANSATPADTDEETLKTFTLAADVMKRLRVGDRIRGLAWGVVAANGNSKTVNIYFGESGSLVPLTAVSIMTGAAYDWCIEFDIRITGTSTQDFIVRTNNGTNSQTITGQMTENIGNAVEFRVSGTNGTASAGDIVCRALEVERLAQ